MESTICFKKVISKEKKMLTFKIFLSSVESEATCENVARFVCIDLITTVPLLVNTGSEPDNKNKYM